MSWKKWMIAGWILLFAGAGCSIAVEREDGYRQENQQKTERQEKEHRFLATLACKAAVKGGMKLDVEEQKRLVDNMISLDNPFTCPHGRPTAIPMTRYEIERKFMRK